MRVGQLETERRYDSAKWQQYGIQSYGERNDYPQRILEIVAGSVSGSVCVETYKKFINGKGFAGDTLYQLAVNRIGETADDLLRAVSADFAMFGGFAIHVNYNANFDIVELNYVPFENVRLGVPNEQNGEVSDVRLHTDWGKRRQNVRRWRQTDIETVHLYDPTPDTILEQVAAVGGWHNYKGQIYYFSNAGRAVYPLPTFDAALTDMNTEEAIADITNRNARNGFMPAGMFVEVCENPQVSDIDEPNDTEKVIRDLQGSKNALKVAYAQVGSKEEIPQFVKFDNVNYDKEFTASRDAVKDSIGRAFNQPPILRSENVGAGFGAEIMQQAYDYYNSTTTGERFVLERVFSELLKRYAFCTNCDVEILPLSYEVETTLAERLGDKLQNVVLLIERADMELSQKRAIARTLYGLTDKEIDELLPIKIEQL